MPSDSKDKPEKLSTEIASFFEDVPGLALSILVVFLSILIVICEYHSHAHNELKSLFNGTLSIKSYLLFKDWIVDLFMGLIFLLALNNFYNKYKFSEKELPILGRMGYFFGKNSIFKYIKLELSFDFLLSVLTLVLGINTIINSTYNLLHPTASTLPAALNLSFIVFMSITLVCLIYFWIKKSDKKD